MPDGKLWKAWIREFGLKSDVIPVERKKDGSFSARSSILEENDFRVISDYVNLKIREIGSGILNGNIALNPMSSLAARRRRMPVPTVLTARYAALIKKIPGYRKRELEKLEEQEALERMKEALETEGEDDGSDILHRISRRQLMPGTAAFWCLRRPAAERRRYWWSGSSRW